MFYFIYILECSNGALYTGYTTDMERRYQEHLEGSPKCKYTRSFPPKRIAAVWKFEEDLSFVLSLERRIKALSKAQKNSLIKHHQIAMDQEKLCILTGQLYKLIILSTIQKVLKKSNL